MQDYLQRVSLSRLIRFYLIRMRWVPYMTLTSLLTLTHHCQVKDDFIILQKLCTQEFSVTVRITDKYRIFKKYSESLLPGGLGHTLNFFLGTSWAEKTCLEWSNTDLRGFGAAERCPLPRVHGHYQMINAFFDSSYFLLDTAFKGQ